MPLEDSENTVSLFFSYSHRDEEFRNELETHLAVLKRQGVITTWHDRRIGAGQEIDPEISEHLETSQIVLLLVSPYFLASDYCYDLEMRRALELHQTGKAVVIPVIVHPCDWQNALFGKLRATPPDGKPISKFSNLHDAYLAVVNDIRSATKRFAQARRPPQKPIESSAVLRSRPTRNRTSNLRLKRDFTDKERDDFLDSTFEYVANYFEESLQELRTRNPTIETRYKRIDLSHLSAAVYSGGAKRSSCRIWLSTSAQLMDGIAYSAADSGDDNSFNELLTWEDDGYSMLLKPIGMALGTLSNQGQLTQQGAAEALWSLFIERLQ